MSARSLRVKPDCVEQVQRIFERNGHCTQKDFGEAINLHPDTIRKFLRGEPVLRSTFQEICEALDIESSDIVFDTINSRAELTQIDGSTSSIEASNADKDEDADTLNYGNEQSEASEVEDAQQQPKSGIQISQNITHNSGLVIGNVQGDVNP